jgi:hypothetical protein
MTLRDAAGGRPPWGAARWVGAGGLCRPATQRPASRLHNEDGPRQPSTGTADLRYRGSPSARWFTDFLPSSWWSLPTLPAPAFSRHAVPVDWIR